MNPELLRNVWLELNERRVTLMLVIVGSLLLLGISTGELTGAVSVAELAFYGVVILWGTRCAATSVTDEVVNKTWDAQRLSAIRPWTMVWGKLVGSTLLIWIGGAMCLAVILYAAFVQDGLAGAGRDLAYFVGMGVLAHSVAMLASLAAVRRRVSHSRFAVFFYQSLGLGAALTVWRVWQTASPDSLFRRFSAFDTSAVIERIDWWGASYDAGSFYVVALAAFAVWTLIGNYRLMRTELQVQNGPGVWIAFLAYVAVFSAGFDGWREWIGSPAVSLGLRAVQAGSALAIVTYVMAYVEPKETVHYRWLGQAFARGRLFAFFGRFPGWAYAYLATFAAGVTAMIFMPWGEAGALASLSAGASVIAAALGFLLRDCAIFLIFGMGNTERRSDLAAVAVIVLLWFLLPAVLGPSSALFFRPGAYEPVWVNPLIAWVQAGIAWAIIFRRPDLRAPSPS